MGEIILHKEILIPKYNEYLFEEGQKWADRGYAQALLKVDKWQIEYLKRDFQIRAADYVEKMTFIKWRLTGPGQCQDKSPLDTLLEYLKPYIPNWGKFRWNFADHLKEAFKAIHNFNYLPSMVKDRNGWINTVLAAYCHAELVSASLETPKQVRGDISCHFVPHPETVESYDSPRFLEMRSLIWKHYTGEGYDLTKYVPVTTPIPGRPCQMEMHLDLSITEFPA